MDNKNKYGLYYKDTALTDKQGLDLVKSKYFDELQWERLNLEQKQFVLDSLTSMLTGTRPPGLAQIRKIREKMGLSSTPTNVLESRRDFNNVEGL